MYGSIHGFLFRYSSHFQDIHLIQDNLFPTFAATNAIIRPRQAAMLMAMRRPVASASQPQTAQYQSTTNLQHPGWTIFRNKAIG